MKTALAAALIAAGIVAAPGIAGAQERYGDGALGAVAGAVVFGPVGAVAGGLTGYFAAQKSRMGLASIATTTGIGTTAPAKRVMLRVDARLA